MSIDFWKLDGTRFSTLPDLVSYNGYVKDANGDVYETKANSAAIIKKQFAYNLTANSSWLSGTGNAISNIAIGTDGSLTATKVNLDDRYFTEQEIKNSYIPWDTRWNGTGGGFYKDGNVFINGNGYSDYLTNILTGIKNSISGLGSIYAKIGDCYTKAESDGRYALKTDLAKKQDLLGFTPIQQGGGYLQGTNKIKIGWSGSELHCQVDNSPQGAMAFKSDISNATITIKQGDTVKGSFTLNGSGKTINLDAGGSDGFKEAYMSGGMGGYRISVVNDVTYLEQWFRCHPGSGDNGPNSFTPGYYDYPYGQYVSCVLVAGPTGYNSGYDHYGPDHCDNISWTTDGFSYEAYEGRGLGMCCYVFGVMRNPPARMSTMSAMSTMSLSSDVLAVSNKEPEESLIQERNGNWSFEVGSDSVPIETQFLTYVRNNIDSRAMSIISHDLELVTGRLYRFHQVRYYIA